MGKNQQLLFSEVKDARRETMMSSPLKPVQKMFQASAAAQHRQNGRSQHGQGVVPIPALPVPYFVMIPPALAFGHLESTFGVPAAPAAGPGTSRLLAPLMVFPLDCI